MGQREPTAKLERVLSLYGLEKDRAAKALADARRRVTEAEQQKEVLGELLSNYTNKLYQTIPTGKDQLINANTFCRKLLDARDAQREEVNRLHVYLAEMQKQYFASRARYRGLETLLSKRELAHKSAVTRKLAQQQPQRTKSKL